MTELLQHRSDNTKGSRAHMLIRRLWAALETIEGHRVPNQALSGYLNLSDSALSDWAAGKTELNQIEAFLRLCERIEHSKSAELFRQHLRVFPTLRSPELAHDPATMDRLRELLRQSNGVTMVAGGNASQRTFLFTALGHTYLQEGNSCRSLAGWDIHPASWFVPLAGVRYLADGHCEPHALHAGGTPGQLILSNGLWERFSHHRTHLLHCALTNHVIVADSIKAQPLRREILEKPIPLAMIEISTGSPHLQIELSTQLKAA